MVGEQSTAPAVKTALTRICTVWRGAERIIVLGRHADRIALARDFGATDVVSERGDAAVER